VNLYALDADGNKTSTPVASTVLNDDGTYQFSNLTNEDFDPRVSNCRFLVEADPCTGDILSRLVTATGAQDISFGSTLVTFVPRVKHVAQTGVPHIPVSNVNHVQGLLNNQATSDIQTTYQAGLANGTTTTDFQSSFGFDFSELKYSLPTIQNITHPASGNELQLTTMSASATHWNPTVTLGYIWKVNGVVKSTASSLNWTPGKNEQGSYTVDLYVGIDTGSGLDVTKSYTHSVYSFTVDNTFPPIAPILSLTSNSPTNSQVATLSLDTGAAMANCQTFSKLVFTESSTSAVLTLPSSADFNSASAFTCATAGAQSENFTVSSGDGNHTIALWAQDAAGNISQVSDFVNLTLDTTGPVVSALTIPSSVKGNTHFSIPYSVTDTLSGVNTADLYYAADGVTFVSVADLTAATSPYSWSVPNDNTSTAKLRIVATDTLGNSTTVTSNVFAVDSTPPAALTLALTNPGSYATTSALLPLTKTVATDLTVTGCSGDAVQMYIQEVDTAEAVSATTPADPAAGAAGWISCAATKTVNVNTGDGRKTFYAWAKDSSGNISAVSNALPLVLDQTSPTLSLTALNSGNSIQAGSAQVISWSASDAHLATSPIKVEYSLDGVSWNTLAAAADNAANAGCTVPSGSTGCYPWTTPLVDSGGNPIDVNTAKIRLTVSELVANPITAVTGNAFSIRSTGPVLSSVTINGGAEYAGTTLVNVKIALSDHGFATTGIKVALNQAATSIADCVLPSTPTWLSWTNASTNVPYQLSGVGGLKKVCVWAKNAAGLTSATSTFTCTVGTDCNTIELQTGTPPVITTFSASSGGTYDAPVGADIAINWAASAQGTLTLDNNPISIAYTINNSDWFDIVSGKDISTATTQTEADPATAVMTWLGGLSGNPTSGSGTIHFTSPSSSFSRLRAVARDSAGNYSIVAYSGVFNTTISNKGTWQIYAGSSNNGDGGSGVSAKLRAGYNQMLAIDPVTGDIYARHSGVGIRKLDVKTGKVSTYIRQGTNTLSTTGGPLAPAGTTPTAPISADDNAITFSRDGYLYISVQNNGGIYKINVRNDTSTLYLGGGTLHDSTSDPFAIYVHKQSPIAIDEDNTLYFYTDCMSDTSPSDSSNPPRLMKAVQNSDGTAGAVTTLAGNCNYGSPSAAGTLATAATIGPVNGGDFYAFLASIVPVNHGQVIYFGNGQTGGYSYKIVNDGTDNRFYRAHPVAGSYSVSMYYNPIDGQIYFTAAGDNISKFTPVTTAANDGEVVTQVIASDGTDSDCMSDGKDASATCIVADAQIAFDSAGTVYFVDGIGHNSSNGYRIRYLDSTNKVSTIFGSLPFYGDGLPKELIRGALGGIYYKKTTTNETVFPQGLYLVSPGMVFGYIDPSTGIYTTLWGNQHNGNSTVSSLVGTTISSGVSMGIASSQGNGYPLAFDDDGLPWMRIQTRIAHVDVNKKIQSPDVGSTTTLRWDLFSDGAAPNTMPLYVNGGWQNFSTMGNGLFLMSGYYSPPGYTGTIPQIRFLDFTNNVSSIIIGKGYTKEDGMTTPSSVAVGDGTTTPVKTSPLSSACINSSCKLQYFNSKLYFSDETKKIRIITHPEDPLQSSLSTLGLTAPNTVANFIVKEDESQIFYVAGGGLYCYPLTAGGVKTWCPSSGSLNLYSYAGKIGSLGNTPNMFTWMDSSNLLISTGSQILQYTLPSVP
jgi:hypothetical protein